MQRKLNFLLVINYSIFIILRVAVQLELSNFCIQSPLPTINPIDINPLLLAFRPQLVHILQKYTSLSNVRFPAGYFKYRWMCKQAIMHCMAHATLRLKLAIPFHCVVAFIALLSLLNIHTTVYIICVYYYYYYANENALSTGKLLRYSWY